VGVVASVGASVGASIGTELVLGTELPIALGTELPMALGTALPVVTASVAVMGKVSFVDLTTAAVISVPLRWEARECPAGTDVAIIEGTSFGAL
jgi:hypothetical protein